MANDDLSIWLRLRGAREFITGTKRAGQEVKKLGTETDKAGDKAQKSTGRFAAWRRNADLTGKATRTMGSHIRRAAGAAVGLAAGLASIAAAKSAVNTTVELAKGTMALNRVTGLGIGQSSEIAAVARVRNIATKALNQSLGKLSKAYVDATEKGGPMLGFFKDLGITQKELKTTGGDFNKILGLVADGFAETEAGPKRNAATMGLLGRGWQTLTPLMSKGSKTLEEQRQIARDSGATFDNMSGKQLSKLIDAQRRAQFATLGLQIAFGTKVAPALTKVIGKFSEFVLWMRKHPAIARLVITGLLAIGAALLVVAVGFAVISIASAPLWLGIAAGIAIVVVVIVVFRKRILGVFRSVLSFLKGWGRLVLFPIIGPFGLAYTYIISKWRIILGFIRGLPKRMGRAGAGMWDWVKNAFRNAINWVLRAWNGLNFKIGGTKVFGKSLPSVSIGTPDIPLLAGGGTVMGVGSQWISGESGAEVGTVLRGGVAVQPLGPTVKKTGLAGMFGGRGDVETIRVPIFLDGRQIAEATAKRAEDQAARR